VTEREEIQLMFTDPQALWVWYCDLVKAGQALTESQAVRFEYCSKVASAGL
jgi:hypothetical protein